MQFSVFAAAVQQAQLFQFSQAIHSMDVCVFLKYFMHHKWLLVVGRENKKKHWFHICARHHIEFRYAYVDCTAHSFLSLYLSLSLYPLETED